MRAYYQQAGNIFEAVDLGRGEEGKGEKEKRRKGDEDMRRRFEQSSICSVSPFLLFSSSPLLEKPRVYASGSFSLRVKPEARSDVRLKPIAP
jgi:hypothetical protein